MDGIAALAAQHEFLPRRHVPLGHREQPNHSVEQIHDVSLRSLGLLEPLESHLCSIDPLHFRDRL